MIRVIGIDPGLRNMGWGIIDVNGSKSKHIANGVCKTDDKDMSQCLKSLHQQLSKVLVTYKPDTSAVEHTFVNKDAAGSLKLGQARAICLLVPAQYGLQVAEYAPNKIKKVVVGVGHASKQQVAHMVRVQLGMIHIVSSDASDALAIALCHAHHVQFSNNLDAAIIRAGVV